MRALRWPLALVIALMLIDAWTPEAAATTRPRTADGPGTYSAALRP
jgi:hypothetical protein